MMRSLLLKNSLIVSIANQKDALLLVSLKIKYNHDICILYYIYL